MTADPANEEIAYEVREGIGRLTFNRPQARNALTFAMYERLREVCSNVPLDGSVKAIILSGSGGRAFAAGTDMTQFRAFETPEDAWAYEERIDAVLSAVEACPVPTIAALTGACTGGGAGIAACCDIRIATPALKFGFPIARTLGQLPLGTLAFQALRADRACEGEGARPHRPAHRGGGSAVHRPRE